ncbi:MAG: hypothetical protein ACNYPI_05430 [Arenicellales bacterium WSBS_2016_MAG_OTU3]
MDWQAFANDWRKRHTFAGKRVTIEQDGQRLTGVLNDIDADGALLLHTDTGEIKRIMSGEINQNGGGRPHRWRLSGGRPRNNTTSDLLQSGISKRLLVDAGNSRIKWCLQSPEGELFEYASASYPDKSLYYLLDEHWSKLKPTGGCCTVSGALVQSRINEWCTEKLGYATALRLFRG